jgi:hypothetical protein
MSFVHEEQAVAHHVLKFIHAVMGNNNESFMSSDEHAIYASEDWMGRIFHGRPRTECVPVSVSDMILISHPKA